MLLSYSNNVISVSTAQGHIEDYTLVKILKSYDFQSAGAEVWVCTDKTKKELILKVVDTRNKEAYTSLVEEAEILKRFKAEGITGVPSYISSFDYRFNLPLFAVVEEKVEGVPLIDNNLDILRLPEVEVVKVIEEVLRIVGRVHSLNIIHRDIKPENIIYNRNSGKVVVIDWGTACNFTQRIETPLGTIGYAPPEQYKEKNILTVTVDVYAIGLVFASLLTGVDARSYEAFKYDFSNIRNSFLRGICEKASSLAVKDRYQSCSEMIGALTAQQQLFPVMKYVKLTISRRTGWANWRYKVELVLDLQSQPQAPPIKEISIEGMSTGGRTIVNEQYDSISLKIANSKLYRFEDPQRSDYDSEYILCHSTYLTKSYRKKVEFCLDSNVNINDVVNAFKDLDDRIDRMMQEPGSPAFNYP